MPLKLMKAFLWHVRCIDFFGSWQRVVTARKSAGFYDDHFSSASNVKDVEAKRKNNKSRQCKWGSTRQHMQVFAG
jgi:hypothetical protein